MTIETRSPEETFETGFRMGERARAGQVYTLAGDLGVGKNCIYAGICERIGRGGTCQQSDIYDRAGI